MTAVYEINNNANYLNQHIVSNRLPIRYNASGFFTINLHLKILLINYNGLSCGLVNASKEYQVKAIHFHREMSFEIIICKGKNDHAS